MFTIKEILEATDGKLIQGKHSLKVSGISIDSRTIKPNELFVAIKGEHFNGHSFITQARRSGAGAILFSNTRYVTRKLTCKWLTPSVPMIKVKDTVCALGDLAHYHRARFKIPIIAITGSNGKTTTKEMLSSILSRRFNVLRNPGTQNNHIGVPLALLNLRTRHKFAVIEIGANHAGEIDRLSRIVKPTAAIITNIGPSHLKFFKSLKGILRAKLELIRNLAKGAKLVINKDDRYLSQLNGVNLQTVTFGINRLSNFQAENVEQRENEIFFLVNRKHYIVLPALGRHNVYNALAGIACARNFGISYNEIKNALVSFQMPAMRMQMSSVNNIKIINDCYNSNPESLRCALDFLKDYSTQGKKIVIFGDMLELGRSAKKNHLDIGKRIAKAKIDFLITVGSLAKDFIRGAHLGGMPKKAVRCCHTTSEAAKFLRRLAEHGDIVLIKGSRAIKMENVIECFTSSFIH